MPATGTNCGSRHAGDRHLSPRRQLQVLARPQSLPWQLPHRGRDVDASQAICGSQHIVGDRHVVGAGMPATATNCGSHHAGNSHQLWEPACRRQPPLTLPTASGARQAPVAAMAAPTPRKRCRCQSSNLREPTYCGRPASCGSHHSGDSHLLWEPACRRQPPIVGAGMPATATSHPADSFRCSADPSRCHGSSHTEEAMSMPIKQSAGAGILWEPACRRQAPLTLPTASGAQQAPVAAMAAPTPRKGCRCQSSNLWEQACCRRPACCGSHHAGNSHQLWEPACRRQPPLTPPIASGARQTPVAAMAAPTAPPTATLNQSPASSTCSAARGR